MKKIFYSLIIVVSCVSSFLFFSRVNAQQNLPECDANQTNAPCVVKYQPLAPLPPVGGIDVSNNFYPAQNGALSTYLNLLFRIFIGICAILAVIMIIIGGMEYMTSELVHNKEQGKHRMTNAILGLLLALAAYALLYTINSDLLNSELKSVSAVTVEVQSQDTPQVCVAGGSCGGYITGDDWTSKAGPIVALPQGVSVCASNGQCGAGAQCTTVGQQNCTSTRGLSLSTINTIMANCPTCSLTVTGGTETWLHSANSSHRPGSATVDLRVNDALTSYIAGGQPLVLLGRYSKDGVSYLYEGDHWHAGA